MRRSVAFLVAFSLAFLSSAAPINAGGGPDQADRAVIELARAHVTIDAEGMFTIDPSVRGRERTILRAIFAPLNAGLASVDRHMRPTVAPNGTKGPGLSALAAQFCGYVPKWAFQAFAWYVILVGGYTSIVALFVSATIFGLPAGAVLGAAGISLGITGSFLLWYVDNYMPPYGVYVCVF